MNFEEFCDFLHNTMADNDLDSLINEDVSRKFFLLTEHMLEVGKSMNLTAIKEEKAVILRHYADSLSVAQFLPQNAKIIDIGCGAGFPCLPLAICRTDLDILALDSTEKRIKYVSDTAKLLHLPNVRGISARAEDVARGELREAFDVALARAVAELPVLSELCIPFVRLGGRFLAMKARRAEEELQSAQGAIKRLGGKVLAAHTFTLVGNEEHDERTIIEVQKVAPTPADLPRPYARILKKPL